jgi:succinate dehydrogenase / fumarate reductase cytochrome b subunit
MLIAIPNPHFLLRRLHSLSGLLPIGTFLAFHLWENSQARLGMEHYNGAVVGWLHQLNYLPLIEVFAIALPILFHAAYGLVILRQGRSELRRYPYLRSRLYWLQRASGVAILLFLILHVGLTRISSLFQPAIRHNLFAHMQDILSDPWMFALYVSGLLLSVFHLCNGIWSMGIVWGLTTSPRAQRLSARGCATLGVVLAGLGIHGLLGFVA